MPKVSLLNLRTGHSQQYEVKNEAPEFRQMEDRGRGYVRAGKNNLYFQDLAGLINGSGIAAPCVATKRNFIMGGGWNWKGRNKNKDEFFQMLLRNKVLRNIAQDLAYFEGYALNIRYNAAGKITDIRHIDYSACRLGIADAVEGIRSVFVSADWSKAYNSSYPWASPQELPVYNPDPVQVRKEMHKYGKNYMGQVLYYKDYKPAHFYYVPPTWTAADDRLEVDRGIGKFHASNIDNGFFPGMMLYLPGTDWTDTVDEDGKKTKADAFKEWFDQKYQGAKNSGEVLKLFGNSKEDAPQPVFFQPNVNGDMFLSLENNTVKYIPSAFQVPPVLAGISQPGQLGQTQQLLDEIELFQNNIIKPEQDRILETIMELQTSFEGFRGEPDASIVVNKPLSYIPESLFSSMTLDELRAQAGLSPADEEQKSEILNRKK